MKSHAQKTKAQKHKKAEPSNEIFSYVKSLAIALVMALLLKHFVIEAYRIPTGSMEDTILVGDFLLANKFIYGVSIPFTDIHLPGIRLPKQGDVVIFKFPLEPTVNYVKRCIAGPGQTVEIRHKRVYVDGELYHDEAFTKHSDPNEIDVSSPNGKRDNYGPLLVPKDSFFMMGDNRDNSYDSRFWGFVPKDNVLGEALFLHWSWAEDSNTPQISAANPLSFISNLSYNFLHFYERVRWNRLGKPVK